MQPHPIVRIVQLLHVARLHRLEHALQLTEDRRQQLLVADVRQRRRVLRQRAIVRVDHVVEANRRLLVGQVEADAHIADGALRVDLRADDEAADFRATVGVDVVGPLESDVEILRCGE